MMQKLHLEDFLMYNFLSDVKIAPDGYGAAYLVASANEKTNGYDRELCYFDKRRVSGAGICLLNSEKLKSYAWLSDRNIVYAEHEAASDNRPDGCTKIFFLDMSCGVSEEKCELDGFMTIEGVLADDTLVLSRVDNLAHQQALNGLEGEAYLAKRKQLKENEEVATVFDEYPFWFNGRGVINKTRKALYRCSLENGELTPITPYGFRTEYVAVSGNLIAYSGCYVDPIENYLTGVYVHDVQSGESICVQKEGVCHIYDVALWNDHVVICASEMDHYSVSQCPDLILVHSTTRKRTVLCDYQREINVSNPVGSDCRLGGGYRMKASGDWLYFIMGVEDASHIYRCDMAGNFESVLEKDGSVDCIDVSGSDIFMVAMHDMRLQELNLLNLETGDCNRVTSWNDDCYLSNPPVAPEKLNFTNRDGIEIHGFVLKPVGYRAGEKYPVILDIHGGPHLSYGAVYYHEMQYWANHGYFVVYCNPRGGEGRGNEFGFLSGRFGTVDYDDLMEFCDEVLKAYPAVDAQRMGVTGGSYGGFMTNWIIGHTNRFAAAVSQRGISNFVSMEGTSDIGTLFAKGQIGATTHTNVEQMWSSSPLKYADQCTTPTLFIHAEEDYRCWMVEALQMYTAVMHNGVQTRLCLFHNENHELSRGGRPKGRIRRLQEITNWMDAFLKPRERGAKKCC